MEIGTVTETVEVSSLANVVDTTQSKVAVSVEKSILDNIPKGRSFESVIPFAPGARQEPLQSVGQGTGGFQIDGASDSENVFLIDGINTTNIQNGGVGRSFQMDFVQEVQIKSSSFEAEFGGALGGVINAVPKHGSNEYHGSLFSYLSSNAFNANNGDRGLRTNPSLPSLSTANRLDAVPEYYMANKDQATTVEPGYEIGGPAYKNKLWFYSSYIPRISTTRRVTNFTGANPGQRTLTQTTTQHNAYNRLDYGVTNALRLYGSWNYAYFRTTGSAGRAGQPCRTVEHRPHHRPEYAARRCRFGESEQRITASAATGPRPPNWWSAPATATSSTTPRSAERRWARAILRHHGQRLQRGPGRQRAFRLRPSTPRASPTSRATWPHRSMPTSARALTWTFPTSCTPGGTHTFKGGYFWSQQGNDVLRNYQRRRGQPLPGAELLPGNQQHGLRRGHRAERGPVRQEPLPGHVTATSSSVPA